MKNSLKNISKTSVLLSSLLFIAACNGTPSDPSVNAGDPERLIDSSSETVTLGLSGKNSLSKLASALSKDAPARAELKCSLKDAKCAQAKEMFDRRSVPITIASEASNSITLFYERTVVRDCDPKYLDNMNFHRSYNHPAFGCAISGNMMQMVSDKRQFTSPALLDLPDAEKSVQSYGKYLKPTERKSSDEESKSTTKSQ